MMDAVTLWLNLISDNDHKKGTGTALLWTSTNFISRAVFAKVTVFQDSPSSVSPFSAEGGYCLKQDGHGILEAPITLRLGG